MIFNCIKSWLKERRLRKQARKLFDAGTAQYSKTVRTIPRDPKVDQAWSPVKVYNLEYRYPEDDSTRRQHRLLSATTSSGEHGRKFCSLMSSEWQRYVNSWINAPMPILIRMELQADILNKIYLNLEFDQRMSKSAATSQTDTKIDFDAICDEVMKGDK